MSRLRKAEKADCVRSGQETEIVAKKERETLQTTTSTLCEREMDDGGLWERIEGGFSAMPTVTAWSTPSTITSSPASFTTITSINYLPYLSTAHQSENESQQHPCQGVCDPCTPMKKGVRTLTQPYHSKLCSHTRGVANGRHYRNPPICEFGRPKHDLRAPEEIVNAPKELTTVS